MTQNIKNWWKAALTRAIKTAAQAALGGIGAATMFSQVGWEAVLSAALLAAIVSILTSIAGVPEVSNGASVAAISKDAKAQAEPETRSAD